MSSSFAMHFHRACPLKAGDVVPMPFTDDNGVTFDNVKSRGDYLVFNTAFHHMNDSGSYDGWTDHTVTLRPSFIGGFDMHITGRDRREIKEYIAQCFHDALNTMVDE